MRRDTATDDGLLSDVLIGVVDDIRRDVHGALGTRPWSVTVVHRTWSGGERGVGHPNVRQLELDPDPSVARVTKDRMGPAGRESAGTVVLSEVSLSYTEKELDPGADQGGEVAYVLRDNRGTMQRPRWFVLAAAPVPRRGDRPGDDVGWYILLNETSDMGLLDEVSP